MENKFRLIIDADFSFEESDSLVKGSDSEKKKRMIVKGLVSTPTKDADGETLLPSGFDLTYLKSHGFINWNHQAKKDPEAIIGEPLEKGTEIIDDKFMIRAELYDTPLGRKVFKLGNLLKKGEGQRKLAFSLEGYAIKRNSEDSKIVEKAMITHVAVTPAPKNTDSYLELSDKAIDDADYVEGSSDILETVTDCQGNELCLLKSYDINELSKSQSGYKDSSSNEGSGVSGSEATLSASEALTIIGSALSQNLLSEGEISSLKTFFSEL